MRQLLHTGACVGLAAAVAGCGAERTTGASTPPIDPGPCPASQAVTAAVGQVIALSGSSACVAGGAIHQEFVVVAFNGASAQSLNAAVTFTGTGLDTVTTAAPARVAPTGAGRQVTGPLRRLNYTLEARLRAGERAQLTPLFSLARRRRVSFRATTHVRASSRVGDLLTLNMNTDVSDPCGHGVYRVARVAAVTNKAIVLADTGNPPGGFTDAEYQALGTTFDTLVFPLDSSAFGAPTDIDGNGRILLLFTATVNALTPANSDSYVGGFFFGRDLFPTTSMPPDLAGCAGSNYAEMFYLMVPDSTGVTGNRYSHAFVDTVVVRTLAHEMQHLINLGRRVYVNTTATGPEDLWLDDGLSHEAEELLFYRTSRTGPRQHLTAAAVFQSPLTLAMFNAYGSRNVANYLQFLRSLPQSGPYIAPDAPPSAATRGATWSLLRYLADRRATTDGVVWFELANSTTTGLDNLKAVFGDTLVSSMRNWATAIYADGLSLPVDAAFQQPSWNFRSIVEALGIGTFPLPLTRLTPAVSPSLSVDGGGAAYVRFATKPGITGLVQWTPATSDNFALMLVRVR